MLSSGRLETIGDGGIDLRKDSDYYTVSNTWIKGVNKAFGIGWTENVISKGTLHHNYFDGTNQRGPSADNMQYAHLYNNYVRGVTSYGHYMRGKTNGRVENIYFEGGVNVLTADAGAVLTAVGNIYDGNRGTVAKNQGTSFNPASFYNYSLTPTKDVPTFVKANAGPRASVCSSGTTPASTTIRTTTRSVATTTAASGGGGSVPQYGQCGGSGWTGAIVCVSPFKCTSANEWYSQCL